MFLHRSIGLLSLIFLTVPALAGTPDLELCSTPNAFIGDSAPPVEDPIVVPEDRDITDLEVFVDITHTWMGDIDIEVIAPSFTTVRLHDQNGGNVDNMLLTYSDSGIPNGAPFTCNCLMQPTGPGQMADFVGESSLGTWTLFVSDPVGGDNGTLNEWCVGVYGNPQGNFIRGDANGDGSFGGLADGLYALSYQFVPSSPAPPCFDAADADNNGVFNGLIDAAYILNFQFVPTSPPPPAPYPGCGPDDDQAIGCETPPPSCNP